jgi:transposase
MDYFASLDISMDETHVCILDRKGVVVRESKTASTAEAISAELSKAPSCRRIVFETGRMAPILFHGLNQLSLPVVRVGRGPGLRIPYPVPERRISLGRGSRIADPTQC